jgi:hypothetical protein
MSELMNVLKRRNAVRRNLLTTVSALTLLGSVYAANATNDDSDHPAVWIELGGQLERVDAGQTPFTPPFFNAIASGDFESPLEAGKSSIYSNGFEGTVSFMPDSSDWVFSGSVRYGRSDGHRFLHEQQKALTSRFLFFGQYLTAVADAAYAETRTNNSDSHFIADFQAGKDVGLGMFGNGAMSTVNLGVRFAQFSTKSDAIIRARPDVHFVKQEIYGYEFPLFRSHVYFASAQRVGSFRGIGPSISFNASTPLNGNPQGGVFAFDWGANAAILLGRQKAKTHHYTSGSYHFYTGFKPGVVSQLPPHSGNGDRSRSVIVPNIGGFAGFSFRYANAKVSVGYRGDFFFGAMDGGIDAAKKENRGFYGPFAAIGVGIP